MDHDQLVSFGKAMGAGNGAHTSVDGVFHFSIAIATSSFRAVLAVAVFTMVLLAYIKPIEEREATFRFGDEYVRYKRTTPFMIPRL